MGETEELRWFIFILPRNQLNKLPLPEHCERQEIGRFFAVARVLSRGRRRLHMLIEALTPLGR